MSGRETRLTRDAQRHYETAVRVLVRAGFARRLARDPAEWALYRALELLAPTLDSSEGMAVQVVLTRQPQALRHYILRHPELLRIAEEEAA